MIVRGAAACISALLVFQVTNGGHGQAEERAERSARRAFIEKADATRIDAPTKNFHLFIAYDPFPYHHDEDREQHRDESTSAGTVSGFVQSTLRTHECFSVRMSCSCLRAIESCHGLLARSSALSVSSSALFSTRSR